MFNAIVHGMGRLLAYFFQLIPNYGVAIILLTVAVRLAMIPLAIKQAHSMAANRGNQEKIRKLAPEVKKIKEKHKDDRAKQYEEQKKLYDAHGINMLGGLSGCLPMLLQTPIFMAMYQVLAGCNKLFGSGRRCVPGYHVPTTSDLHGAIVSGKATFLSMNLNVQPAEIYSAAGLLDALPYYLLIAVMGYTMWYQMKQMSRAQPVDPQFRQTQKVMQIMPVMLVVASLNFPTGLTVYWTASNIWTIAQQYVLMKRLGIEPETEPASGKAKGSGVTGKPGKDGKAGAKGTVRTASNGEQALPSTARRKGQGRAEPGNRRKGTGSSSETTGPSARARPGRDAKAERLERERRRSSASAGTSSGPPRAGHEEGGPARDAQGAEKPIAARSRRPPGAPASQDTRGSSSSRPAKKAGAASGKAKSSAKRKSKGGRK